MKEIIISIISGCVVGTALSYLYFSHKKNDDEGANKSNQNNDNEKIQNYNEKVKLV